VHHQPLNGLALDAVDLLVQHAGGGNLELIPLPAHGLNEDGEGHLAPARHVEGSLLVRVGHTQGHVLQRLPVQPVPQLAGGDELALLAGKGGVVDGEGHLQGGGADLHEGQRLHAVRDADGVADGDVGNAAHGDDVAGGGLGHRIPGKALELVDGGGSRLAEHSLRVVVVAHDDVLVLLQGAPLDAADGDPAHEVVVVDGADQHLEGLVHIRLRGGDILQNGLKQGLEVRARHVGGVGGGAVAAGAEQHGGVQLFRGGIQVHQQLQHLIHHLVDPLVGPVDLVDHHNDPVAQLQG
ncbi:Histidinol phosphatase and related hydrolases of the PHP family, partial [Dysosmobacter welbionis]